MTPETGQLFELPAAVSTFERWPVHCVSSSVFAPLMQRRKSQPTGDTLILRHTRVFPFVDGQTQEVSAMLGAILNVAAQVPDEF